MNLIKVKCAFCGKEFFRERGQFNEAKKFGWKQYCSKECLAKDRTKKRILFCENCGKPFARVTSDISPHNYCSLSCAATINNKKYPKKRNPQLKICLNCGKPFRKSRGNKKYCSLKCRREAEWHSPEKSLDIIRSMVRKLGRVPTKRESRGIESACKRFFGSWNNAVVAAGFQPNRSDSQRMYKRTKTRAMDGHLCDSVSETLIDNWLAKNKITHERNVSYPKTNHKADWGINLNGQTIFVEYFGLAKDSPRYDRSIAKKKALCRKYKINLIEIYPWDLYPERKFEEKIKKALRFN